MSCTELLLRLRETPLATVAESVSTSLSHVVGLCVCPRASYHSHDYCSRVIILETGRLSALILFFFTLF